MNNILVAEKPAWQSGEMDALKKKECHGPKPHGSCYQFQSNLVPSRSHSEGCSISTCAYAQDGKSRPVGQVRGSRLC